MVLHGCIQSRKGPVGRGTGKGRALPDAGAGEFKSAGITSAYQRILGGLAVTLFFFLFVKVRPASLRKPDKRKAWPWVLANGLAGPTLGVSCYQWALKTTPTGVVLPIVALTPIVIIPFSRYLEGGRPGVRSIIGSVIAVGGAVALALSRWRI